MKVLYFDCFSGISGDMTLGALLDLGIDQGRFRQEMDKLNLPGYEIRIAPKLQNGIAGLDVTVILTDGPAPAQLQETHHPEHFSDQDHHHYEHDAAHEHGHNHDHDHEHDHGDHPQNHSHGERNLADIEAIIDGSSLGARVKEFSKKVFREIARAEAKVHQKDLHEVHFHEVGAVDSIVDIVGTAVCLDLLGVAKVFASPLHDGSGWIECRHGKIPVPVPAVLEMLAGSGIPLLTEDVGTELVTPTGMGLIKCLAAEFGGMPSLTVEKTGYGMGKRETGRMNALRVMLGNLSEGEEPRREAALREKAAPTVIALETNIDDMSPEILGFVAEKLLDRGALDVFYTPVYMKKNRPAFLLTVLTDEAREAELVALILRETSTFGIRRSAVTRYCMDREIIRVPTEIGTARVKIGSWDGIRKAAPEYEDCRQIAAATGLPLRSVYETVLQAAAKLPDLG